MARRRCPRRAIAPAPADGQFFADALAADSGAAGRPAGRRDRRPAARRAARCSRSCSKARPSCCRATSRRSQVRKITPRLPARRCSIPIVARPRLRRQRRRLAARQPRRRKAAVGRRGSDGRRVTLPLSPKTRAARRWSASSATSSRAICGAAAGDRLRPTRASAPWRGLTLVLRTSVPPMSLAQAATGVDPRARSGAAGPGHPHDGRRAATRR